MSTGKQLSLWSGMTEAQLNQVFHKTKTGKNALQRAQRKTATMNQKLIVQMRKDLRPNSEIAKHLNLHVTTVVNFLREYFGDKDPLDLHIVESYQKGEAAKAIARRLRISLSIPCRILKNHGIDPWKNYLERESESFRETGVSGLSKRTCRNPDRPRIIAEDLYCVWLETGNLEEVALETGWSPSTISAKLNAFVPKYKADSRSRRDGSKDNAKCLWQQNLSGDYRTEKEFVGACLEQLEGLNTTSSVRGLSSIEIDILVVGQHGDALIECKVRSRKPDLCKALGQAVIAGATYGKPSRPFICLPDDVRVYDSFIDEAKVLGVCVCHFTQLRDTVNKLLI